MTEHPEYDAATLGVAVDKFSDAMRSAVSDKFTPLQAQAVLTGIVAMLSIRLLVDAHCDKCRQSIIATLMQAIVGTAGDCGIAVELRAPGIDVERPAREKMN